MKQEDLDNLGFLMNLSEEDFDLWLNQASDDDVTYALEIIQYVKRDYLMKELELLDSFESELSEAKDVINSIKTRIKT
jgi:hypothetical protein